MAAPSSEAAAVPRAQSILRRAPPQLVWGAALVSLIVLVAVIGPILSPYAYDAMHIRDRFHPPSTTYLLGADEYGCITPLDPIRNLRLTKEGNDVQMIWDPHPLVYGYNVWYVTDKADIDLARLSGLPIAIGVAGCSPPDPAVNPSCADQGAILRTPALFFYQVRAYCGGYEEGP